MANVVEIIIRAVDQTAKGLSAPITNLQSLEKVLNKVSPAIVATAAAFAGGIASMVGHSINLADETAKLSQKLGMSTESLSTLSYVADLSGLSSEALSNAVRKLNMSIVEGASQAGAMSLTYERLGIALKNADGSFKMTDRVLAEVADAFAGMEDGAAKTKVAVELFGKAGADMIPLLNGGSEGLKKLQDEARGFGLEISGGAAKSAEEFNDNLTRLKAATMGVANQVAAQVLPTLVQFSQGLVDAAKNSDLLKSGVEVLAFTFKSVYSVMLAVYEMFASVGQTIGYVFAAIYEAAKGNLSGAEEILVNMVDTVGERLTAAKIKLADLWVPDPARAVAAAQSAGKRVSDAFMSGADPKKLADSQARNAAAISEAGAQLAKTANEYELAILEASYRQRGVTVEEFYSKKKALAESSAQAEIDAQVEAMDAINAKMQSAPKDSGESIDLATEYEKSKAKVMALSMKLQTDLAQIESDKVEDVAKASAQRIALEQDAASEATRIEDEQASNARRIHNELNLSKLHGAAQLFEAERQNYEARRQQIDDLHLAEEADMEARLELQQQYQDRLTEIHQQGLDARAELDEAIRTGNLEATQAALDSEGMQREQDLAGRRQMAQEMVSMHNEAHRNMYSYLAEVSQAAYQGVSSNITAAIMGTKSWGQAFAAIGQMMLETLVRLMVQRVAAFALEQGLAAAGRALGLTMAKTSAAAAAGLAASWAPAATLATIATLGSAAGLGSLVTPVVTANTTFATAAATVGAVGAAHGGLDNVPDESTYLLQRGERVLSPRQNQDLTRFITSARRESLNREQVSLLDRATIRESVAERLNSETNVNRVSTVYPAAITVAPQAQTLQRSPMREVENMLGNASQDSGGQAQPGDHSITVVINQTIDGEILSKTIYRGTRDGSIQVHPNGINA